MLAALTSILSSVGLAQSMYIKNTTSCTLDIGIHGNDMFLYPAVSSSIFTLAPSATITFNELADLNCSTCIPAWTTPAGVPFSPFNSGAFSGAVWDAVFIRTAGGTPGWPFTSLGPLMGTTTTSPIPGCPGATADWHYWGISDSYEVDIY